MIMRLKLYPVVSALALVLATGGSLADDISPDAPPPSVSNPQAGMGPATGPSRAPQVPYVMNPYEGMFGSMGNVYSPYYRQFHQRGMSGMTGMGPAAGIPRAPEVPYVMNPYEGMFGSMGNVYSPYYRQFHQSDMNDAMPGGSGLPQGTRHRYPYFLPPTMGTM